VTGAAFVFDAGPRSHFARAGRLDALRAICGEAALAVTEAVLGGLARGSAAYPSLRDVIDAEWLEPVRVDGLAELAVFAE